jgi:hypothetical protein
MSMQAKLYPAKVVANAGFEHLVALGGPHFHQASPWVLTRRSSDSHAKCFVLLSC